MTQAAVTAKVQYRIGGMACGFCVATIGKAIGRMPGVRSVHVNLAHEETLIEFAGRLLPRRHVFKNGVPGEGPFKFQPDVFDNPPGSSGYTPLRELNLVTWKDAGKARELKPADEVRKAVERAEIVIERPGVVINMPLLTWPGGQR